MLGDPGLKDRGGNNEKPSLPVLRPLRAFSELFLSLTKQTASYADYHKHVFASLKAPDLLWQEERSSYNIHILVKPCQMP